MSQVGEAHKMMQRHLDWAAKELKALEPLVLLLPETDAPFILEIAMLHLENAQRLAEQIDSGIVYGNKEAP